MNATVAAPHLRGSGRTREAPYGVPEALLAAAVAVFLAMLWCLMLPDGVWQGERWALSWWASWLYDDAFDTPTGRAYAVTMLLLVQTALLISVWRGRRLRYSVQLTKPVSDLPAFVTLLLGLAVLTLVPAWLVLGGGGTSRGPTFLLAAMVITGIALVFLALSRMPRSRAVRRRRDEPATETDRPVHVHGGLATPTVALDALRETQPGFSYTGIRRREGFHGQRPVGFSLTHVPDHSLVPSGLGVALLGFLSLLVALPSLVLATRSLLP